MPAAFDKCVKSGGRVRTMRRPNNKYQKICYKGGKSYAGHIKKKKGK